MYPVVLELGPLTIHSFGVVLAIAFLLCGHLYAKELGRRGLDPDLSSLVLTWAVIGGLAGARLYYLVEHWGEVKGNLLGSVFSGAGLVAYGGFAGGIAASWLAVRRRRAPVVLASDAAAPFLALGYAIGRIGCLLAGDGDYGPPTDLPWGMAFPDGFVPTTVPVHPTPIYEFLMMSVVFAVLYRLRLRPRGVGWLFATYLVLQGVERVIAELWRTSPRVLLGLSAAQLIAVACVAIGFAWRLYLRRTSGAAPGASASASTSVPAPR